MHTIGPATWGIRYAENNLEYQILLSPDGTESANKAWLGPLKIAPRSRRKITLC